MAGKSVNFNTNCDLDSTQIEWIARWLSCNGEVWGVGPTLVFASAAALFLYNELQASIFAPGDVVQVTIMEKTLVSTMVVGMLALMIHLWVCLMRFFQYYLDTLIKDSPNMLLELTTAGILGAQAELVPLGPLTRFLRQQQPQIHITVCWFLSLCYADYVRKNYCRRFNMPYLEQWQAELQERASRGVNTAMSKVNNFVGAVHHRLTSLAPQPPGPRGPLQTGTTTVPRSATTIGCSARERVNQSSRTSTGSVTPTVVGSRPMSNQALCVRLVSQSSETTADAVNKLREYIKDTRCACATAKDGSADSGHSPAKPLDQPGGSEKS